MRRSLAVAASLVCAFALRAERIELAEGDSTCVVDTFGARVVSCKAHGQELLWTPETGVVRDPVWSHGGIPVVWPWFGRLGEGVKDIHGYAWKNEFAVRARSKSSLTLALETESASLEVEIRLGAELALSLRTTNRSRFPAPFAFGFHPYFRVGERDRTVVEGVKDEPMRITGAIDGATAYDAPESRREYRIRDEALGRTIRIAAENLTAVNVWNPDVLECPGVIPSDAWRHFVAVEPIARGFNRFLVLGPGQTHVLRMSVAAE